MLAAKHDQMAMAGRLLLDQSEAAGDVAEGNGEIADIGERQGCRVAPGARMVAIDQHAAGMADGVRPETGAAAIGGADIQRNAGDVQAGLGGGARDAHEAMRCGEGWDAGHGVWSCRGGQRSMVR